MSWKAVIRLALMPIGLGLALAGPAGADEIDELDRSVWSPTAPEVRLFFENYCLDCHSAGYAEAGIDLDEVAEQGISTRNHRVWEEVLQMLSERVMPPAEMPQPDMEELEQAKLWIDERLMTIACELRQPGRVTLRRLNRAEYNNTIRDLVGVDFRPADDFPADDVGEGFDNIGDVLTLPPILLERYLDAADSIVEKAWADPALRGRLLGEGGAEPSVRGLIERFGARAFRRPVTDEEIERYLELAQHAAEAGQLAHDEQLQLVVQAILVSPHFLFRVEQDPQPGEAAKLLDDFELASRLSYFLWSSMPDEELFELAAAGRLQDEQVVRAQVRRMLADSKVEALVENFAGQWLQLRNLEELSPDLELFPSFDEPLREAMLRETQLFFATVIEEDRSVLDFLNADFSYVNGRLAEHYGISGVEGAEFRRVSLPPERRGVLTQASILTLTSNPTRTSPVKRGQWIMENILGTPPAPPPPGVEELEEEGGELLGTLRERTEQHRSDPNCATCHQRMDPLGFGLENFDAVGQWRTHDGRFAIDASGSLPDGLSFDGPTELMGALATARRTEFTRCLTQKLLTYALGRGLESYDRCTIEEIVDEFPTHNYRFSSLVQEIVLSEPFRMRSGIGGEQ